LNIFFFFFNNLSRPAVVSTQPPIQWVLGAPPPGVKQTGCDTDHSSI